VERKGCATSRGVIQTLTQKDLEKPSKNKKTTAGWEGRNYESTFQTEAA
jgi:hypothetical protein